MNTLALNPIALDLGFIKVNWYGIILGLGALTGLWLAIREGKRFGIKPDLFMDLLIYGVVSSIIGARAYYVAFKWDEYKNDFWSIFKIWNGGIAIYGALIGAFICGYFFFKARGYSFWRLVDICAPGLLVGQMIGRWGNFMNQEAYGGPVSEELLRNTLKLPGFIVNQMFIDGLYRHPTFLYESMWSLLGLVLLFVLRRQKFLRAGELVASYFIWYSIGRFYIEALRTDSLAFMGPKWLQAAMDALWSPLGLFFDQGYLSPAYGNVRSSQLLALLLIIGAVILIVVRRMKGWSSERYLDPIVCTKPDTAESGTEAATSAAQVKPSKVKATNSKESKQGEHTE